MIWSQKSSVSWLNVKATLRSRSNVTDVEVSAFSKCIWSLFVYLLLYFSLNLHEIVEISTKSWRGYVFTTVCLCVCLSVCLCVGYSCEQNFSRTDASIWTQFSLNCCLSHWLGPCWNWWPWVKGQGQSDLISIFSS